MLELLGGLLAVLVIGVLIATLVARAAHRGPCPRCGRPVGRGELDCRHCGFCITGPKAGGA